MSFFHLQQIDSVAVVWLDQEDSKINVLSISMLEEFSSLLDTLENDASIESIVLISRKPDCFIAGADIQSFTTISSEQAGEMSQQGNQLLLRLANLNKPVIAAIHGSCLGGGLEVALACHYRIASNDTKTVLGVPEVKLGLLPGGGGCTRLPSLIGLRAALDLLLSGKNIYPHKAKKMGLVDEIIHPEGLVQAAIAAAKEQRRHKAIKKGLVNRLLENTDFGRNFILSKAQQAVEKKTLSLYPAPLAILKVVTCGLEMGFAKGLEAEGQEFSRLHASPECKQLVKLFLNMQAQKYHYPASGDIQKIAIIGSGFMGAGIAEVSILKKIDVTLKDVSYEALGNGEKLIWKNLQKSVKKRVISAFERDRLMSRIHASIDINSLSNQPCVIEAVFEDLALKQAILNDVETVCNEDTIFASNTSSLPIKSIAEHAKHPENVIGMHYFSPVPKMPLLEIITTDKTDKRVTAAMVDLGIRQGKTVIVVGDGPGFYTTRILTAFTREALYLLHDGASIESVDHALKAFGFPVGPITLIDEVGIDVGAHISRGSLSTLFSDRGIETDPTIQKIADAKLFGRKSGQGFYLYPKSKSKKKSVNESIYDFFSNSRKSFIEHEIQERVAYAMINEAAYCLQEGIIASPTDADLGAVLGLGFPPFQGGPFNYCDSIGSGKICDALNQYEDRFGARFTPSEVLKEAAENNRKFYK